MSGSKSKPDLKVRTLDEMFKKIRESSENDPEQLAHTSGNSPALSLSETDSGPVESKSSQTGATKSDLEPSVSTTDTQQNIEPPYPDIAKLTAMDDTVKRKLLSSKWNDSLSYIQISKQVHKLETKYSFLILYHIIIYDNDTCIT
jgi:hypothetical protein